MDIVKGLLDEYLDFENMTDYSKCIGVFFSGKNHLEIWRTKPDNGDPYYYFRIFSHNNTFSEFIVAADKLPDIVNLLNREIE